MKFLQIATFYDSYLLEFYKNNKHLANTSYEEQFSSLLKDGFGASHMIAPYLVKLGYDSRLIITNCQPAQFQWATENSLSFNQEKWFYEIVINQIETFRPDILYILDPINFDSKFIRSLTWKPSLILGWRAASIPHGIDWTEFDAILSNLSSCQKQALTLGAKSTEIFFPGFPVYIADAVQNVQKEKDVVFSGQCGGEHKKRIDYLNAVAKAPLGITGEFSIGFFISANPQLLPAGIAMNNYGARWGLEMYRMLKKGRIVINIHLDIARDENRANNMRLFETTGVGSFLLTDYLNHIDDYFEPGKEIDTFKNQSELIEKIYYYLSHSEEREAIASRGQQRCLRDYSMTKKSEEFDMIIQKHLKQKVKGTFVSEPQLFELPKEEDPYDIAYKWGWENSQLRELVFLCYKTPNFAENARRFYISGEFHEAVRILSELGKKPGKNIRVLDFGCGNGIASYSLSRIGYSVVGVDSSLGEIAGINAAKKIQGLDGVNFELVHSTGEKIDFPENSFDVIWIREALHHIKNLSDFLTEIKRILKPDGILCCLRDVVIWNENQREHFFATHPFNHITKDEGCYYLKEYLSAFEKAGLLMEKTLYPSTSIINTYPNTPKPGISFDENKARQRQEGYDLFSFFARKPQGEEFKIEIFQDLQGVNISIGKDVQIIGFKNILIGEGSCIADYVWLNVCVRDEKVRMKIGKCVLIGRQSVISTAGYLEIGDYCVLAPRVFVSDADHVFDDIYQPVLQQGTTNNRSVIIEENCWLGMQSIVTGNLTVGRGSVVAANAVVTKDVPPFSIMAGVPAKVIKMYNFVTKEWERIKDEAHIEQILKIRESVGMPDREEYKRILNKNATLKHIDPIVAGKGINI